MIPLGHLGLAHHDVSRLLCCFVAALRDAVLLSIRCHSVLAVLLPEFGGSSATFAHLQEAWRRCCCKSSKLPRQNEIFLLSLALSFAVTQTEESDPELNDLLVAYALDLDWLGEALMLDTSDVWQLIAGRIVPQSIPHIEALLQLLSRYIGIPYTLDAITLGRYVQIAQPFIYSSPG